MTSITKVLHDMNLERLNIVRDILANIRSKIEVKKVGESVSGFPDDTLSRELKVFKLLRQTFAKQLNGNAADKAISTFAANGVNIVDGKYKVNKTALDELHKTLSPILGEDIAKRTTKDIKSILSKQWKASKEYVAKQTAKVNRNINSGLTKLDRATIEVLNNQNNFYIGGVYNTALVDKVNQITTKHVESGLPRQELDKAIRNELSEDLPVASDVYYRILSNDVLNRARQFAQTNSYVEAKIRKYEIVAVMDERTTEICKAMNGRVFEVEIARKIVRDVQNFGVPQSDAQADKFNALKPWIYFDQKKAGEGQDALYFKDAKGGKIDIPGTTFDVTGGAFQFSGDISQESNQAIQELGGKNVNPPCLPPFHANCRTTTIISEEDVKLQDWTEGLGTEDIGVGSELGNDATGGVGTITGITPSPTGPSIGIAEGGRTTKVTSTDIATSYTPTKIQSPPKKSIESAVKTSKQTNISAAEELSKSMGLVGFKEGPKKVYKDTLTQALNTLPNGFVANLKSLKVLNDFYEVKKDFALAGQYNVNRRTITLWAKGGPTRIYSLVRMKRHLTHEIGHHIWNDNAGIKIPLDLKMDFLAHHRAMMKTGQSFISTYAKTDAEEHFSEAISAYFMDKNVLKACSPLTFNWIERNMDDFIKQAEKYKGVK